MNTPVSFELAKALKEKGFDRKCASFYDLISSNQIDGAPLGNYNLTKQSVSIPTIATVVMWLYEKHEIWVSVNREPESGVFFFSVDKNKGDFFFDKGDDYNSPTEAYEAAIEYTLKKLL